MIKAFGSNIAVKEIQKQDSLLFIGDSVGLERVVVVSIPDELWKSISSVNDYSLEEGSEIYIKVDSSKKPYITVGNEKVFFILPEEIVAVDTDTVKFKETPDTDSKESK